MADSELIWLAHPILIFLYLFFLGSCIWCGCSIYDEIRGTKYLYEPPRHRLNRADLHQSIDSGIHDIV